MTTTNDRSIHSGAWEISQGTRQRAVELVLQNSLPGTLSQFDEDELVRKADVLARYLANGRYHGEEAGSAEPSND